MAMRNISTIDRLRVNQRGPGLLTRDIDPSGPGGSLDPFISVSLFEMTGPAFPPHPHAGFSVVTYILPESENGFVAQDSLGNVDRIGPGSLNWTIAGSGILHEEQPEVTGKLARGFQIWIDHANTDRQLPPGAHYLHHADVPKTDADGALVRAVLGESNGIASPLATPTHVRLIDVELQPQAKFEQLLMPSEMAFIVVIDGEASAGSTSITSGSVARLSVGSDMIGVTAGPTGARFFLFSGKPFEQQHVQHGPFIASDHEELATFITRHRSGAFGSLRSFAAQTASILGAG
jgi:redox-sensitive bicupin YhaK (pirin superfamily)